MTFTFHARNTIARVIFLSTFLSACGAFEFSDTLTGDKLPPAVTATLSPASKGSITPTANGVLLASEATRHAFLSLANTAAGTNANPLRFSARLRTSPGYDYSMMPELAVFWDAKNYAYIRATSDTHAYYGWVKDGVEKGDSHGEIMREVRFLDQKFYGKEAYFRIAVVDSNLVFYYSRNGMNWEKIAESNVRPGPAGAVPALLIGRGMPGAKPLLANDTGNDSRSIPKLFVSDLSATDSGALVPADNLDIAKKETWEKTLEALEGPGVPKTWSFLTPVGDRAYSDPKDWIDNEKWSTLKDVAGRAAKFTSWTRPEDEADDALLDLRDVIDFHKNTVALARTEIAWPVTGEALLWFDSNEPCRIWLNNTLIFAAEGREWWADRGTHKDRRAITIALKKGLNVLKMAVKQVRGDTSFSVRFERNDAPYLLALNTKMLELFPPATSGWRARAALLEMGLLHETNFDFNGALSIYERALTEFKGDEESRVRALESLFRVASFLHDYDRLVRTADTYLASFPDSVGSSSARRAAVRGEALAGKLDAARKRIQSYAGDNSAVALQLLRELAGALAESGRATEQLSLYGEIAKDARFNPDARSAASLEQGLWRLAHERNRRNLAGGELNPDVLQQAAAELRAGIELLPSKDNPEIQTLLRLAEDDQKQKNFERSAATVWGAALLARLAADPAGANYFAVNRSFTLPAPLVDDKNNPITDVNQFKDAAWKSLCAQAGDPAWTARWRVVSFRRNAEILLDPNKLPEHNPDPNARYGDRSWNEIDTESDKTGRTDMDFDVRRFSGDGQIVYLLRDFDSPKAQDTLLQLSNAGGWTAWLDNQLLSRDLLSDDYHIEADRIPLKLSAGRHRLLIKLELPPDGAVPFHARISTQPHLAMHLLACVLLARNTPATLSDRMNDFNGVRACAERRLPAGAVLRYAQSIALLYSDQRWFAADQLNWASIMLHELKEDAIAANVLRDALHTLEDYGERRTDTLFSLARSVARSSIASGAFAQADELLREYSERYPIPARDAATAWAWRGGLRVELGMGQAALPFFERCVRVPGLSDEFKPLAQNGLARALTLHPERIVFESSNEIQSALDGVRRQFSGTPEDAVKAARSLSEILRTSPAALIKADESPFSARFVGAREYVRNLLDELSPENRDVYRRVVGDAAAQKLRAIPQSDPFALERAALDFPFTAESRAALSRAGDLYLDRAQYGSAISLFSSLLREASSPAESASLCAKLARAYARHGEPDAAHTLRQRLAGEFASVSLNFRGTPMNGAAIAAQLASDAAPNSVATDSARVEPYMGSLARLGALQGPTPKPGAVAWAQPLVPSNLLDDARGQFGTDSPAHLQSHPVTDGKRIFVGALESLRALDPDSGKILWTQTWGAPAVPQLNNAFSGFPSSLPALAGDKIVTRAQAAFSNLRCYNAATGELLWSTETQPDLKRLTWLSDPAIAYGAVFAVFAEVGDFSVHGVAALDLETGRPRWRSRLISGNAGIKVGDVNWQSSASMGPPAIDGGEIVVCTGLASVACLNAFTGEPRWASRYTPMQLAEPRIGAFNAFDLTRRVFKAFSRGPLPPLIFGDLVIAAPQDFSGLLAFRRRDGVPVWSRELADCRYVPGLVDGKLLACDDALTAYDAATGALVWRQDFGDTLYGCPEMSGGLLYYPGRLALRRIDVRTGRELDSAPWDSHIGPCANPLLMSKRLIAVNERSVVALYDAQSAPATTPTSPTLLVQQARRLEREGKLEEAAATYARALADDHERSPQALAARIRLLIALNKRDEARNEIQKFETSAPETVSSGGGLWLARREALARSLRRELGEPAAAAPNANDSQDLGGILCYSHFYAGESPVVAHFNGDAANRIYARLDGTVQCIDLSASPRVAWSAFIGGQVKDLVAGGPFIVAVGEHELDVLDRDSGELASHVVLAGNEGASRRGRLLPRAWRSAGTDTIASACVTNLAVFIVSNGRFDAWDTRTGQLLWSRTLKDERSFQGGVIAHDNSVVRVYQQHEIFFAVEYDATTGAELKTLTLDKQQRLAVSRDHRYITGRMDRRLFCADLWTMTVLWRRDVADFDPTLSTLEFADNQIRFAGPNRQDGNRNAVRYLDVQTGADTAPPIVDGEGARTDNDLFTVTNYGTRVSRLRAANNVTETVWAQPLTTRPSTRETYARSFRAGALIHCLSARLFDDGSREQLVLRTYDWADGRKVSEQVLPGTPIFETSPLTGQRVQSSRVLSLGGSLVYTAREGLFVFRSFGENPARAAELLKQELHAPNTTPLERLHLRRGLAGLEQPDAMAFIVPVDARVDGALTEWQGVKPIVISDRANYVPDTGFTRTQSAEFAPPSGSDWGGPQDLSAKLYAGWNREGVMVAVDVHDDIPISARPGREGSTGDRVRLVLDAYDGEHAAPELGSTFTATLALSDGVSVFTPEFSATAEGRQPQGKVAPAPDGKGRQYEFFVPWTLLRKDSRERPGERRELRLGVAIFDDDGAGTKGALEWGTGLSMPEAMPLWLGRLSLIDVSAEKIERYRKIIEFAPDTAEALKFLKLILLSKRGDDELAARATELEQFIRAHPASSNTPKALSLLRDDYAAQNAADASARLTKFMDVAKIGEPIRKGLNAAFKIWVYPDPQHPPKTIAIQFCNNDWNWGAHRAYWGAINPGWGRTNTKNIKCLGEIPPPGRWTELTVPALELNLESVDLRALAFTHGGGNVFYDNARWQDSAGEVVLMDDQLPPHWQTQHSGIQFVDQPRHDGTKSWTLTNPEGEYFSCHINLDNWQPIITFHITAVDPATKPAPAQQADIYRQAAQIISDTPEGLELLSKALNLTIGTEQDRSTRMLAELKQFLKSNPASSTAPDGYSALKLAFAYLASDPNPLKRCEELIADAKLPWSATRPFYTEHSRCMTTWNVLGPFPAQGERRGMELVLEPERGVDLKFKTQANNREIAWQKYTPEKGSEFVDLKAATASPDKNVYSTSYFAYAYTRFTCPEKRKALFAYGADDVVSIWLNGKRVVTEQYTTPQKDNDWLEVQLRSGENEILIKTGVTRERAGFYFRICDFDGRPFDDL